MTVAEAIETLEAAGWRVVYDEEELRQFTHDSKTQPVTVSGKLDSPIPPGVLRSLLRCVQVEEGG